MANYDWPFGTLPFGLFGSNLDTRDLETYPKTSSGNFWNMSIFDDSRAVWVLFRKWVVSENQSFLDEGVIITPLIGLVLGGQVPRLNHGPIWFPIQNTYGGAMGCQKLSTTFLTLSQRVKVHLLSRHCIKNLSIGGAWGALLNLSWIFEYITDGPFAWLLSADFVDVKKVQWRLSAIFILIFEFKTSIKV